jgi:hypothetical protein
MHSAGQEALALTELFKFSILFTRNPQETLKLFTNHATGSPPKPVELSLWIYTILLKAYIDIILSHARSFVR